jgi:hypothetical protein
MFLHRRFIKFVCLALLYMDGTLRALTETGTQAVTEVIRRQYRFAVYHRYGAFCAGWHTESAAVTFFRIDGYNFSQHGSSPFV